MSTTNRYAQPFALTDLQLRDIEAFAAKNQLDQIGLLCAELRCLRAEYLSLSKRVGQRESVVKIGVSDAPPVP
jgi:hypothetical protein